LHLKASAGAINDVDSAATPFTRLTPDQQLMGDGKPVLLNQLTDDPRVPCREWWRRRAL